MMAQTNLLHALGQSIEVAFIERIEQCLLVREVLIHGANRHTGAFRHPRRRQSMHALSEQNLSSRFEDCLDSQSRSGLTRPFAGFQVFGCGDIHMRIQKSNDPSYISAGIWPVSEGY